MIFSPHRGFNCRALVRAAALAAVCLAWSVGRLQAALDPFATLTPITDNNPGTNELGFAGVEINATAFKNQSLVSVGDYQFTSFYTGTSQASHELLIARRNLATSPNTWDILHTGFTSFNVNDAHNVSTIGIDGDGFLHASWGMHNHPMQYARSTTSVLNNGPLAMTGLLSNALPLQSGGDFTYPEFYNIPGSGDLLFTYRTGGSGNGEYQLARWNNATDTWTAVHAARNSTDASAVQPWIDNDFSGDANVDANAYHNGLAYDSTGRLHVTWTWRGTSAFQSNHNIMYAYSDDHGVNWRLQNGALLQRDPTGAPAITHDIDEANATPVVALPTGSSLINQTSSAIGPDDHLYTSTYYAPNAGSGNHTRQYFVIEYDGTTWERHQVGVRATENGGSQVADGALNTFRMSRPIVMTDDENRLFMVFSDHQRGQGVTVAYSENEARNDWQFIDLATNDNMRWWEPKYDLNRWKEDGVLSMLYQPVGNGLAPTPVSILEWNARAFFNGSLVLEVDRATGAVALRNTTDAALGLSGYSIASSGNQLAPGLWRSLADQGATGWTESSALAASLAEASGTPLSIASGGSRSLGRAYAGQALAFGVDAPADLVFETTIGGQTVVGQVVYTGASSNNLTLMVDPQTGEARLKNTSPFSVAIDGYSIASASDSLSPAGWTSLDDQNAAGGDWVEANVDSGVLTELKPTANTLLAAGDTYSLGNLFSAATGMQDLTFGFLKAGANALTAGVVLYTPVTPSADFDNDNDVDGADFVLWQRGLGRTIDATQAEGDADHDFDVDAADLAIWRSSFGTAGAAAAAGAVPEPGAATLLALAGLGCVAAGGRRGRAAVA